MLGEGLYSLELRLRSEGRAVGSALAVVRNGTFLGADAWGGVFSGSCAPNASREIRVKVAVPAGGELVTGFKAGPDGAAIDLVGVLRTGEDRRRAAIEIVGQEIDIELSYLVEPGN